MEAEVKAERSGVPTIAWRGLSANDIHSLVRVANKIHPDLPEDDQVFKERIKLFPEGCLALAEEGEVGGELYGYIISHPIIRHQPPALNQMLGQIAPEADQYYIHDLVILPQARGCGFAQKCLDKIFAIAGRFSTTSLVSVYGTASFWSRFGFTAQDIDETLKEKLLNYGEDAVYLERKNE
ncbi:hypothetical protein BKA66DRAFT_462316 [Pyrenochaeta sp. MPI-SDFR-AT-0127]|nr:hypothetical protein BKA66DRAFT_462316 [Pyrenochaeta sp. MPI-SDFR-AT-0127]